MWWGDNYGMRGRCDAKCHNAVGPQCQCMCGGTFHGRARTAGGLQQAVDEHWEDVTVAAKRRAADQGLALYAPQRKPHLSMGTPQLSFFETERG